MTDIKNTGNSRRSFFLKGGAALGAGLASATAGATGVMFDSSLPSNEQLEKLHAQLGSLEDKEAIRQLQLTYHAMLEERAYKSVVELFADEAKVIMNAETFTGKQQGIKTLFTEQFAEQTASSLHTAFRQDQTQKQDEVRLSDDRQSASAIFHCLVEVTTPLTETSVIAQMARLQGQSAQQGWENGRFETRYIKVEGQWKIAELRYIS